MANRRDFYSRQKVTESELDDAFAQAEAADRNVIADLGLWGILANAVVSQHSPVADLTVDVSGPAIVYDQAGKRIAFSALQNVDLSKDSNAVSTGVSTAGKEKQVSLFLQFTQAFSDPRTDGNGDTVYWKADESFQFLIQQGAEANVGTSSPVALRADAVLLADVTLTFGQASILAANISTARRQDWLVQGGTPNSLRVGTVTQAIQALLADLNAHITSATAHASTNITYAGGGNWADGTTNPATNVGAQLSKILTDLAASTGAAKVGAAALPNWTNGSPNPAGTLQAVVAKIVSDLSAAGASLLGSTAVGGISSSNIQGALVELDSKKGALAGNNAWTGTQTFNPTGDNTVRSTTVAPTTRKLIDSWASTGGTVRWYTTPTGMEMTINAQWSGGQWVADNSIKPARRTTYKADAGASLSRKATTNVAWSDGSWDAATVTTVNGTDATFALASATLDADGTVILNVQLTITGVVSRSENMGTITSDIHQVPNGKVWYGVAALDNGVGVDAGVLPVHMDSNGNIFADADVTGTPTVKFTAVYKSKVQ